MILYHKLLETTSFSVEGKFESAGKTPKKVQKIHTLACGLLINGSAITGSPVAIGEDQIVQIANEAFLHAFTSYSIFILIIHGRRGKVNQFHVKFT